MNVRDPGSSLNSALLAEAKRKHFWVVAFPGYLLIILSGLFYALSWIQSSRAETLLGSILGALIFSLAGIIFWFGCQGVREAHRSLAQHFPEVKLKKVRAGEYGEDPDVITALITSHRIVENKFVEYKIELSLSGKNWSVWRRYSDFYRAFKRESEFAKSLDGVDLPPKVLTTSQLSPALIESRTVALNHYIRELLKAHAGRRADQAFVSFFGL